MEPFVLFERDGPIVTLRLNRPEQRNAITTNDQRRDGHLRSGDFFDAEKFPAISFKSNAVFAKGEGRYTASGDLTIRDISRPVSFDIELLGIGIDAMGSKKLGATATVSIDRTDFGLTWNMPVPNGVLVGERVKIEVDLQILIHLAEPIA